MRWGSDLSVESPLLLVLRHVQLQGLSVARSECLKWLVVLLLLVPDSVWLRTLLGRCLRVCLSLRPVVSLVSQLIQHLMLSPARAAELRF